MSVNIHGKEYITVAERVKEAHEACKTLSITTEVLPNGGSVIVKATVVTDKGTFTGISAANPSKAIEKMSPYEVAETSAVGRALGFAGFGMVDGIATADEMAKSDVPLDTSDPIDEAIANPSYCPIHSIPMQEHTKNGAKWYSHKLDDGTWCNGK